MGTKQKTKEKKFELFYCCVGSRPHAVILALCIVLSKISVAVELSIPSNW